MAEYIYALTGAVLLSELFMLLMPEGKMKGFARTAVGMLLMLMLLIPMKSCSLREITAVRGHAQENAYKTFYSDIIMDIYTDALDNQEMADG